MVGPQGGTRPLPKPTRPAGPALPSGHSTHRFLPAIPTVGDSQQPRLRQKGPTGPLATDRGPVSAGAGCPASWRNG